VNKTRCGLQRKGLITPEGFLVEEPPAVVADPAEPSPPPEEKTEAGANESADKKKFACE
jgi:hypothetical protein